MDYMDRKCKKCGKGNKLLHSKKGWCNFCLIEAGLCTLCEEENPSHPLLGRRDGRRDETMCPRCNIRAFISYQNLRDRGII